MLSILLTVALTVLQVSAIPVPESKGGVQFAPRDYSSSGWDYDNDKIKGINLGGWFVLEPFITPSLFEAFGTDDSQVPVDEYHYTAALGEEEATQRLQEHWSTWITEDDFKNMADAGLNLVRIPIGYWAFQKKYDDPYVQGQVPYFDQAIEWARSNGLKVWVDLHGAPGSQNGFDNSGLRDTYTFLEDDNLSLTLTVLQQIFDKYGDDSYNDVIVGIELINEPLTPALDLNQVNNFWNWGYENLRSVSRQNVVIQDGFTAAYYFDDKFKLNDYWGVVIDHHHYQVFSVAELQRSIDDHISVAYGWGDQANYEYHWNVCGEWSAALTDCQKWLNGVNRGARYDGTYADGGEAQWIGSCEGSQDVTTFSDEKKDNYKRYIEAQLEQFNRGSGWIFWTWKTETSLEWDFQRLTASGLFPSLT
jgi:glucan 1,3-beta-glucosidase